MRCIVTGGGTGGHIYPAISIAQEILRRDKTAEVLYVGTQNSLEESIAKQEGFTFKSVHVMGLPRKLNRQSVKAARMLVRGLRDAGQIIKSFNPDVVIGTGGYVSGPMVYQAAKRKIKTVIQEQNAYPGITNKLLARKVDLIVVAFEEAISKLKQPQKTKVIGNPVRIQGNCLGKDEAKALLGFVKEKPLIVAMGGSGGQRSINEGILDQIELWQTAGHQILLITGNRFFDEMTKEWTEKRITNPHIKIVSYSHDMPLVLEAADVVVTSSSAMTLAEVAIMGIPAVLIPKSYTAEDHQLFNARAFATKGAAILIEEKDLTGELLYREINRILNDEKLRRNMEIEMKAMGRIDATKQIVDEIEHLLGR